MTVKTSKSLKTIAFQNSFVSIAQRRVKKVTGKVVDKKEIKRVWKNWLEEYVIKGVLAGKKIPMGKYANIYVQGTPLLQIDALPLIKAGKCVSRNGTIRKIKFNRKRKDIVYEVVYENELAKSKLYFDTAPPLAKRLTKSLNETNTYYKICNKIKKEK